MLTADDFAKDREHAVGPEAAADTEVVVVVVAAAAAVVAVVVVVAIALALVGIIIVIGRYTIVVTIVRSSSRRSSRTSIRDVTSSCLSLRCIGTSYIHMCMYRQQQFPRRTDEEAAD